MQHLCCAVAGKCVLSGKSVNLFCADACGIEEKQ